MRTIACLFLSNAVASWLKMFDPALVLRSWSDLVGKPLLLWIAGILVSPFFELLFTWPAYVLGGGFYVGLIQIWDHRPCRGQAVLLGASIGLSIYLLYAWLGGEWIMRPTGQVVEQLGIYTVSAAFFGFCYHALVLQQSKSINKVG